MYSGFDMIEAFILGCGAGACLCFFAVMAAGGDLNELVATVAVLMVSDAAYCAAMLARLIKTKREEEK